MDVAAATRRGVIVTSNLGVNTSSVVEHALALMLALSKQLPRMDQAVRNRNFKIRYRNLPRDLRAKPWGCSVLGVSVPSLPALAARCSACGFWPLIPM